MSFKIAIIGLGFVGLTTSLVFADKGNKIFGVDTDKQKISQIKKGQTPFFEKNLDKLLKKNIKKNFVVSDDVSDAIKNSEIIFICVGTPMDKNSKPNLTYLKNVSKEIGISLKNSKGFKVICVKSTVPPQTTEQVVQKTIEKSSGLKTGKDFGLVMTPEFLKEGSAVYDTINPHLIVIGTNEKKSSKILRGFFPKLYPKTEILDTNIVTAELIKYANNSFLATKISFINTIANICNKIPGSNVDIIAKAIGTDPRIGSQFLVAGPGFGGSCFPKDVAGLIHYSKSIGYDPLLIDATNKVNDNQVKQVLKLLQKNMLTLKNKKITILGTSFKKNTDDIRQSVSIKLIKHLLKQGSKIRVHDPMAINNTKNALKNSVTYFDSISSAIRDTNCIILMNDWDAYSKINEQFIKKYAKKCLVLDTRRFLKIKSSSQIKYIALGKP